MKTTTALVASNITLVAGTRIVLDMVGATGTVMDVTEGKIEILWNRGGKRFWYDHSIAYELVIAK